jgi:hypothetical protein
MDQKATTLLLGAQMATQEAGPVTKILPHPLIAMPAICAGGNASVALALPLLVLSVPQHVPHPSWQPLASSQWSAAHRAEKQAQNQADEHAMHIKLSTMHSTVPDRGAVRLVTEEWINRRSATCHCTGVLVVCAATARQHHRTQLRQPGSIEHHTSVLL